MSQRKSRKDGREKNENSRGTGKIREEGSREERRGEEGSREEKRGEESWKNE